MISNTFNFFKHLKIVRFSGGPCMCVCVYIYIYSLADPLFVLITENTTGMPQQKIKAPSCIDQLDWLPENQRYWLVFSTYIGVQASWNVMAHAKKPISSFGETSPFKSAWVSVQSTTGRRGVRISGSNAGYTIFWGIVKSTGYPLHSPVSSSLPLPCVTVCHHISTGVYSKTTSRVDSE